MMVRSSRAAVLTLFIATGACGGHVNLGGQETGGAPGTAPEQGGAMSDDRTVESDRVARLEDLRFATGLAIVEGDLYLSGGNLLYRCDKNRCPETLESIALDGRLKSIQAYEGRLAGARELVPGYQALGSYALPDLSDEQLAISDLYSPIGPLFHRGFVYWTLSVDEGVYRCALPTCSAGAERLGQGPGSVAIAGANAFWANGGTIYRAWLDGRAPSEAWRLDEALGWTLPGPDLEAAWRVNALAGATEHVYAAVERAASAPRIVRWPAQGGQPEVVLEEDARASRLLVFGEELFWFGEDPSEDTPWTLFSCAAPACAATRRALGTVRNDSQNVIADEAHVYWLAAEREPAHNEMRTRRLWDREIRRAPLLASEN